MFARQLVAALTVVSVALATGCSSDTSEDTPTTPQPSPSASPSLGPRAVAERDGLAAYDAMWQAMAKAGEAPDPDASELRRYAADNALARIVGALVNYRANGQATRGRPVSHASVTSATPSEDPIEVRVVDCGDSTNWTTHSKATGEQISPDPRGRRHITAVVKKIDSTWKVTTFDVRDIGSC